nr:MAG TPA: hypothetical protein [Caudoviricetes sp.]
MTSQRTISSSVLSWANWAEGQGDDQGPTVRRSERSDDQGFARMRDYRNSLEYFL